MTSGIGIKEVGETVGKVKKDEELVAESIHRILNTLPGERPRRIDFGSRIREILFEPNDFTAATLGSYYVAEAIERLEPRVTILEINPVFDEETRLIIRVIFKLKSNANDTFATNVQVQL